jgi:hypothetical protein
VNLSTAGSYADFPALAVDAAGNAAAVWEIINTGAPPGNSKIEGATLMAGQDWSSPADVSVAGNTADAADPVVAIVGGTATAMGGQSDGTRARINVADHPLGGSWSAPRVDGTKLPPGRYKVVVKAHNSAGSSARRTLKLRIVGEK